MQIMTDLGFQKQYFFLQSGGWTILAGQSEEVVIWIQWAA